MKAASKKETKDFAVSLAEEFVANAVGCDLAEYVDDAHACGWTNAKFEEVKVDANEIYDLALAEVARIRAAKRAP